MFFHLQATTELEKAQHDNTILQADVAKLKQELGDYDKVRGQREELLKQRKTIQSLEAGRTGPVFLLRELSEILSPGKGPTFDRVTYEETLRKDPNAGFTQLGDQARLARLVHRDQHEGQDSWLPPSPTRTWRSS